MTTNPYIHMLSSSLEATPGMEHMCFDRRRALFGGYDVFHFHWPEVHLGGSRRPVAIARRLYFAALLARLRLGRTAIVRTVHNVEFPQDITPWERRMLEAVERRTDFRIALNAQTNIAGGEHAVIPHGDFRAWYSGLGVEPRAAEPDTIGFVGLVRRYKGVEQLVRTFRDTMEIAPELRLRVSGNPSTLELAAEIRALAAGDARIELDLRFLAEEEFAAAIMASEGLVLPYRHMHNSGTVLAVLSLGRPVLVPRNEVNEALSAEVGPGWVMMFDGEVSGEALSQFLASAKRERSSAVPNLAGRTWQDVGIQHREAYRAAIKMHRKR
ncbi:MAG: glycosyl transferase [Microbacterium sp.]